MAAASTWQQAVVDLRAVSAIPSPSLLAHACVGPQAGSDALCLWGGKQQISETSVQPHDSKSKKRRYLLGMRVCMECDRNDENALLHRDPPNIGDNLENSVACCGPANGQPQAHSCHLWSWGTVLSVSLV